MFRKYLSLTHLAPRGSVHPTQGPPVNLQWLQSRARRNYSDATIEADHPEETTGGISQGRREFLLYYSNMFIPNGRVNRYVPSFLFRKTNSALEKQIQDQIPQGLVKIVEFVPRDNEGGIFVKYRIEDPTVTTNACIDDLVKTGQKSGKRLFKLWDRHVFLVRGKPWIEDLKRTFTSQIRVTFDGPDLAPEEIYAEMRRYGRIIAIEPPSPSSKDIPRSAIVTFGDFFDASTARNCVNGLKIGDTTIHVSFIQVDWKNPFTKWISSHPRISIPILIALLAGLAFIIFEPIRILSITTKARGYLDFGNYGLIKWFTGLYNDASDSVWSIFSDSSTQLTSRSAETVISWGQVYDVKEQIAESLKEGINTFNVIVGPRGSGKSRVVGLVIDDLGKTPVIQIDCEELLKAKSDTSQLESLAKQIGYRPAFLWTSTLSRFVDLAATSLAGQSSGFAETTEQQAKRMLNTAATAITLLALHHKPSGDQDTDYLNSHPEQRPVVVIRNFRGSDDRAFYKIIGQWAANLIGNNTARVIVMTQDASYEKTLGEVLPDSVLRVNNMTDANATVAKQYIVQSLKNAQRSDDTSDASGKSPEQTKGLLDEALAKIARCSDRMLEPLGGRLSDLQNYSRRICAGEDPVEALQTMVQATELEVEQMFLNNASAKWSCEQAWVLIRKISQLKDSKTWLSVPAELLSDSVFSGEDGTSALRQLEYRELLVLQTSGGRIISVRAGKPLYFAAFRQLVQNSFTCNIMDSRVLKTRIQNETAKVIAFEDELQKIAQLPSGWAAQRQKYLSAKLQQSQQKIEAWELETAKLFAELKKIKT